MFRSRLQAAWNALRGKRLSVRGVSMTSWGDAQYPEVNFENMVKHGWRKNELIFACINKKALTSSQVKSRVLATGSQDELKDHPLRKLLDRPNDQMSEFDFWASIIIFQDLAGRAVFEKERNAAGEVVKLWPLRPDWVFPVPGKERPIERYEFRPPGQTPVFLGPKDVLDFKLFDPINEYQSWPPVAVAARVGDVDNSATDWLRILWQKGGVPIGILKTTQKLSDPAVEAIRSRWRERYGGFENWTEPAVLDQDAEYQRIGLTQAEMGFETLDYRAEARICMVLRVPPIIVGASVGLARSTFSNYAEARAAWWEDDLIPNYRNMEDTLQQQLVSEWPGVDLQWDFSEVPALQEKQAIRWRNVLQGLQQGVITINEARGELGYDDLGDQGEIFLRPGSQSEVPADEPLEDRRTLPEPGQFEENEDEDEDEEGSDTDLPKSLKAAADLPDAANRNRLEQEFQQDLSKLFKEQMKEVEKLVTDSLPPEAV